MASVEWTWLSDELLRTTRSRGEKGCCGRKRLVEVPEKKPKARCLQTWLYLFWQFSYNKTRDVRKGKCSFKNVRKGLNKTQKRQHWLGKRTRKAGSNWIDKIKHELVNEEHHVKTISVERLRMLSVEWLDNMAELDQVKISMSSLSSSKWNSLSRDTVSVISRGAISERQLTVIFTTAKMLWLAVVRSMHLRTILLVISTNVFSFLRHPTPGDEIH
jgi:hypothetical protein